MLIVTTGKPIWRTQRSMISLIFPGSFVPVRSTACKRLKTTQWDLHYKMLQNKLPGCSSGETLTCSVPLNNTFSYKCIHFTAPCFWILDSDWSKGTESFSKTFFFYVILQPLKLVLRGGITHLLEMIPKVCVHRVFKLEVIEVALWRRRNWKKMIGYSS